MKRLIENAALAKTDENETPGRNTAKNKKQMETNHRDKTPEGTTEMKTKRRDEMPKIKIKNINRTENTN